MTSPKSLALGPKCVLYFKGRVTLRETGYVEVQSHSSSSESAEREPEVPIPGKTENPAQDGCFCVVLAATSMRPGDVLQGPE